VRFHPLKTHGKTPNNSGKILTKIHPLLLVHFRNQCLHCMSSQVLVQPAYVHEGLVGFPAVTGFSESGPSDLELETWPSITIPSMLEYWFFSGSMSTLYELVGTRVACLRAWGTCRVSSCHRILRIRPIGPWTRDLTVDYDSLDARVLILRQTFVRCVVQPLTEMRAPGRSWMDIFCEYELCFACR